jgi:hypothetical protein
MKKYLQMSCLLVAFAYGRCFAQQAEAAPSFFTLINTVPKSSGFQCYIKSAKETNVLTPVGEAADEAPGNGFSTGLVAWLPADGDLVAEVPNRSAVTLKPFIEPGQTPLVVLKSTGAGTPKLALLPAPANREGGFYDAVNLTEQAELEVEVDGKQRRLPRGQRVRLGTSKILEYSLPGGPKDKLESMDPPSHVLVFFAGDDQKVRCLVVADYAM